VKEYKPPAFQLYVNDWLGSTKIALMDPAAEGAYIRLLCHAWNDPDTTLPNEEQILILLSRLGSRRWKKYRSMILKCFDSHPSIEGRLHNKRLTKIKEDMRKFHETQSLKGKRGADARWLGHSPGHSPGNSQHKKPAIERPMAHDGPSSSTSTSTSTSLSLKKETAFREVWDIYPPIRRGDIHLAEHAFVDADFGDMDLDAAKQKMISLLDHAAKKDQNGQLPYMNRWIEGQPWKYQGSFKKSGGGRAETLQSDKCTECRGTGEIAVGSLKTNDRRVETCKACKGSRKRTKAAW